MADEAMAPLAKLELDEMSGKEGALRGAGDAVMCRPGVARDVAAGLDCQSGLASRVSGPTGRGFKRSSVCDNQPSTTHARTRHVRAQSQATAAVRCVCRTPCMKL